MNTVIYLPNHKILTEDGKYYLYSNLTEGFIRELDEYESTMVLAAYNAGKGESK